MKRVVCGLIGGITIGLWIFFAVAWNILEDFFLGEFFVQGVAVLFMAVMGIAGLVLVVCLNRLTQIGAYVPGLIASGSALFLGNAFDDLLPGENAFGFAIYCAVFSALAFGFGLALILYAAAPNRFGLKQLPV